MSYLRYLCLLFVGGFMSYLRYLCLFVYNGVQHILCYVFVLCFFVSCTLCCKFSMDWQFFIAPSVFTNVYFLTVCLLVQQSVHATTTYRVFVSQLFLYSGVCSLYQDANFICQFI